MAKRASTTAAEPRMTLSTGFSRELVLPLPRLPALLLERRLMQPNSLSPTSVILLPRSTRSSSRLPRTVLSLRSSSSSTSTIRAADLTSVPLPPLPLFFSASSTPPLSFTLAAGSPAQLLTGSKLPLYLPLSPSVRNSLSPFSANARLLFSYSDPTVTLTAPSPRSSLMLPLSLRVRSSSLSLVPPRASSSVSLSSSELKKATSLPSVSSTPLTT